MKQNVNLMNKQTRAFVFQEFSNHALKDIQWDPLNGYVHFLKKIFEKNASQSAHIFLNLKRMPQVGQFNPID